MTNKLHAQIASLPDIENYQQRPERGKKMQVDLAVFLNHLRWNPSPYSWDFTL